VEGFQKLKQNGIVILTGIPGIGKSRNSLELLRTFCTEIEGYSPISLPGRSEWIELINADDSLIVFIDDVFGRTNDTFDENEDLKLLDIIYSTIQRGTVKVILTMRNTIKLSLFDRLNSHRMLKDVNILDISSDHLQMTTIERKKMSSKLFQEK
jgi:tRNA uridine 5-carbamoylmethylation protein Kti12